MVRLGSHILVGIVAIVASVAVIILLSPSFLSGQNIAGEAVYTYYSASSEISTAVLLSCSDTDGSDKTIKGTTTLGSQSATDSCRSSTTVREFFCTSDNKIGYYDFSCSSGDICHDGACKWGCYDSDAGVNTHHAGWVYARTVAADGSLQENRYYDRCTGPSDLVDYVCTSSARADHRFAFCSSDELCYNGACFRKCTDSDFRDDPRMKGRVEAYEQLRDGSVRQLVLQDSCGSTSFVNQVSCRSDGGYISTGTVCPTGTTCSNGWCV